MSGFILTEDGRDSIISCRLKLVYNKERLEFYRRKGRTHVCVQLEKLNQTLIEMVRDLIIGEIKLHDDWEEVLKVTSELFPKEVPLEEAIERWAVKFSTGRACMFEELEALEDEIDICSKINEEGKE